MLSFSISTTHPSAFREEPKELIKTKGRYDMDWFRQEMTLSLFSPIRINRTVVNGETYATDEKGNGLYALVSSDIARYDGEGALIDETFKLRKGLKKETIEKKIAERVALLLL